MKRRRGDFADADLFVDKVRLVPLHRIERRFDGGVLHKPRGVLREDGPGREGKKDECSHIKKSVALAAFD